MDAGMAVTRGQAEPPAQSGRPAASAHGDGRPSAAFVGIRKIFPGLSFPPIDKG